MPVLQGQYGNHLAEGLSLEIMKFIDMVGKNLVSRLRERLNHVKRIYDLEVMVILVRDAQNRSFREKILTLRL